MNASPALTRQDDDFIEELLPMLKLGSVVLGMLLLVTTSITFSVGNPRAIWACVFTLAFLTTTFGVHYLHGNGRVQWAIYLSSSSFVFLPILTGFIFGIRGNPFLYLATLGLIISALLISTRAVVYFGIGLFALLALEILVTRTYILDVSDMLGIMFILVVVTAVLSCSARNLADETILWALDEATKSNRRETLLRATQVELQETIYEREQLNTQLVALNADLEAARLAAATAYRTKASFMATMSHELRTPLNLIIGFSTAIVEHPEMYDNESLPHLYRDDVVEIRRSSTHLLGLINDILDLAKIEAAHLELHLQVFNLDALLHEMIKTGAGLLMGRPVVLRGELTSDLPLVHVDEGRVRQVLLNLLANACKFTDVGEITLGARAEADHVLIWVRDTGIGITPEDQCRIFGEFEQVEQHDDKRTNGTGLGLAICRWLVQLHGGQMYVESERHQGSTFFFTLPTAVPADTQQIVVQR